MGWGSNNMATVLTFIEMNAKSVKCRMGEIPRTTLRHSELNQSLAAYELSGLHRHFRWPASSHLSCTQPTGILILEGCCSELTAESYAKSSALWCLFSLTGSGVDTHICLRTIWLILLTGFWWAVYKRKWGKNHWWVSAEVLRLFQSSRQHLLALASSNPSR